jgi:hypothetical protein
MTENESYEEQDIETLLEEKLEEAEIKPAKKLDYTLQTAQERSDFVRGVLQETNPEKITSKYLEILSDYIIFAMDKEERKQKNILTENRMITVNKRETSYQGLVMKFENGEDGLYNLITNDKNILLTPKTSITQKDIDDIEPLRVLREAIEIVEKEEKAATGKRKFLLKKQLIEMRQDQYSIKSAYKPPMYATGMVKSFVKADLSENITMNECQEPVSDGFISFFNPFHISALLCNYSLLKEESYGNFMNDCYYLMQDLDNLIERTLKDKYPLYYDLLIYKIDGKQNTEIQELLDKDWGIKHSIEYISSLWRNKIPKLIAEQAKEDYIMWYYTTQERGQWKKCSRCGQIKLAHNRFFSKNKTSKDGFYSICKDCRNAKTTKKKLLFFN